jgi:ADP-heptose:LPS heptosyltransferase
MSTYRRILVIRRDNIGDLVLTTPLIHALREHYPNAWIAALTNSYNAPVLDGNPDLNAVYAYDKAKHRPDRSRLATAAATARRLLALRRAHIDLAILATPGHQRQASALVRWIGAREVLGFANPGKPAGAQAPLTLPVDYAGGAPLHAAEDVFRLLQPLGIPGPPGRCRMVADAGLRMAIAARLPYGAPVVAVHISARRPRQQWPAERYAQMIRGLHQRTACTVLLLWAPGAADDARHPGDDAKAQEVQRLLGGAVPLVAVPTHRLAELAAALACCDLMVCADGGAMHIAAALGKSVAAMFGDSPASRWRPWGVPHQVIEAPGGDLVNLDAETVSAAAGALLATRQAQA